VKSKLDKLDALLAVSGASREDAALFADMLSLPNDGRHHGGRDVATSPYESSACSRELSFRRHRNANSRIGGGIGKRATSASADTFRPPGVVNETDAPDCGRRRNA
jgi:hypothetical protein